MASFNAPLALSYVKKSYPNLYNVFTQLSEREITFLDLAGEPVSDDEICTVIMGVDFTEPLSDLPDDLPLKTNSEANKFAMFVWKLLEACESGGLNGDACRMNAVLCAATDDTLNIDSIYSRFEHLLGLTLAVMSHGLGSFLERGDVMSGRRIFSSIGNAWAAFFHASDTGVSDELRNFALRSCENLSGMLKSSKNNYGPYATNYAFNFMKTSGVKKSDTLNTKQGKTSLIEGKHVVNSSDSKRLGSKRRKKSIA